MLRLAASHPPLWRTPTSLQLGPDPVARIDDVLPWQQELLDALTRGIPDAMLIPLSRSYGASESEVHSFVRTIGRALTGGPDAPLPARIELPADLPPGEERAFVGGVRDAGIAVTAVTRWPAVAPEPPAPTIVVAHRLLDPRRAARLVAADIAHLPVELAGDQVTVGPLVVPGRTACPSCLFEHRVDADPDWPLVAAQLLGRPAVPTDPVVLLEAAVLAARLLRNAETVAARSVTVSAASARRTWTAHRPHERCLCRSPEGIAMADDPAGPTSAPTTATGYARPA